VFEIEPGQQMFGRDAANIRDAILYDIQAHITTVEEIEFDRVATIRTEVSLEAKQPLPSLARR
jgi:hypothetical protein